MRHLVLQPHEVDACFATNRGVDHRQEGGGEVDKGDASLEGARGKTTEVGHHAAAHVEQTRMARCMLLAQRCPHLRECGEVFVGIARLNRDVRGRAQQLAPICRVACGRWLRFALMRWVACG